MAQIKKLFRAPTGTFENFQPDNFIEDRRIFTPTIERILLFDLLVKSS